MSVWVEGSLGEHLDQVRSNFSKSRSRARYKFLDVDLNFFLSLDLDVSFFLSLDLDQSFFFCFWTRSKFFLSVDIDLDLNLFPSQDLIFSESRSRSHFLWLLVISSNWIQSHVQPTSLQSEIPDSLIFSLFYQSFMNLEWDDACIKDCCDRIHVSNSVSKCMSGALTGGKNLDQIWTYLEHF